MKKGEIYEGYIERIDFPNKGRVFLEGQQVTVKNGIPGQKIRFQINKKRKDRVEGRLLEVLERSPLETREPVCGEFPACGGCMYQTMSYESQLEMKAHQVKDLLDTAICVGGQKKENGEPDYIFEGIKGSPREFAYRNKMEFSFGDACKGGPLTLGLHKKGSTYDVVDYIFEGIKGSPREFAYRNKMEFSFGDACKGGPLTLGLHKKGSTYDVVDAWDCRLVHPDMNRIVETTGTYFREKNTSYYHKMQHTGYLRHLLLRRGNTTGEILVNLVTTTQEEMDLKPLVDRLLALPLEGRIVGILHILNDSLSDVVQSDETRILFGQDYFYEELLGLKFKVTPFSFFQPNSYGAQVLYETVRSYVGDTKDQVVFDLYSGTGTIGQIVSAVAKKVVGVEIVEEAVQAARENAARNGITNCEFLAGDVLKVLDEIQDKPDFIILDPPRDGIHAKALPKIIDYGVEKLVYISCKPTSLARDLELFLKGGYRVERACCVDQFCQTVHVETVCCLHRVNS